MTLTKVAQHILLMYKMRSSQGISMKSCHSSKNTQHFKTQEKTVNDNKDDNIQKSEALKSEVQTSINIYRVSELKKQKTSV